MVEADLWIIAVHIIEPYDMMNYQPRLYSTYLTQPTIYSVPVIYVCLPSPKPWR